MPDEQVTADQVAAFWDALVLHQATDDFDVDGDLAAALARFQAMGRASPGAARQRIWQRLQPEPAREARNEGPLPFAVMPPLPAFQPLASLNTPSFPRRGRLAWAPSYLATAALLVVTILISAMALGSARFSWSQATAPRLGLPALETAPIPAADPATAQGLLTQVTVPALPPQAGYIAIERWTYPPVSEPITTAPLTGPMLVFVISGQLTARVEGEGATLRGLDPVSSAAILTPTTGRISAGETLLVPAQARVTTSNPSETAATALVVPILSGTANDWVLPFNQVAISEDELVAGRGEFAPGPAEITLQRTTLDPGESVPAPRAGTFQLVGAESKYLGYLTRSPDGAVTNREKEPLGVLVLTVTQP
jgi:hypothetical protein